MQISPKPLRYCFRQIPLPLLPILIASVLLLGRCACSNFYLLSFAARSALVIPELQPASRLVNVQAKCVWGVTHRQFWEYQNGVRLLRLLPAHFKCWRATYAIENDKIETKWRYCDKRTTIHLNVAAAHHIP